MINHKEKNQRFFYPSFFPKTRQGLSGVVTALLLVLLSVVLVGIVWISVQNLVTQELPEQGCVNAFEKVTLDDGLTCLLTAANELQFSINVADINAEKAVVTVAGNGASKSFEITNVNTVVANVRPYGGSYTNPVKLPGKNAGLTYAYNFSVDGFNSNLTSIRITPIVGEEQCSTSDQITDIEPCPLP
ncbi:hypothetical protein HYT23_05970 [Candidatus Pacearchaeota archaeon]|nr:hypothetical protein [Candidatus Pacearchaeota archaeon]